MSLIDLAGWLGAVLILLAYFLNVRSVVASTSRLFLWLNLLGAALIAVNTYALHAYAATALNVVWGVVAIYGLVSQMRKGWMNS